MTVLSSPTKNSSADESKFRELSYKWSVSWDTRDLGVLLEIAAPQLTGDYRDFPAVNAVIICSPTEFFNYAMSPKGIGGKGMRTQHLLGASMFTRTSPTEAKGNWQVRPWHTRTFKDGRKAEWDSSSFLEFTYVKIDGEWKIGGWRPHTVLASVGTHEDIAGDY
ncbi:hypothetical protein T440DRAFT_518818 [Plenodomus tracheiphilus IPT5]|uniref:Scytalone dehydratase-like domain-containing protein n=1 Tax=Plenodomus tracheiphilus IPT5 TaxID=1408161 RepID=A0A6A7B392_9PLEO|nr:hypothetical protein T440DRAFT_518818 [Plenodomus tracheiphilus IPT5]